MNTRLFHIYPLILVVSCWGGASSSNAAENGLGAKPYLGWSSWSLEATRYPGYGGQAWLTAEHIEQQSDAMAAKLQKYGYTYINIDSGWRGGWDEFGRPTADSKKFPGGIAEVADYVHAKGQKLGIYFVPGIDDDLLQRNPPIKGTPYHLKDIVFTPKKVANGWGGGNAIDFSKPGAQAYIQSIADLFASWKIDFLKFDGVTPGSDHYDLQIDARDDVAAWGKALLQTRRPIWFTLSWAIDMRFRPFWERYANAMRVSTDVESYDEKLTHWQQITWRFESARAHAGEAGDGHAWNDLDSLLIGNGEMNGLTPDERRSAMTLWAINCSPLYSGDDLTKLDDLGLELLTNTEVISVQQAGKVASLISSDNGTQIWATRNEDGSLILAFFNLADQERHINSGWKELGLFGPHAVHDLWTHQDQGNVNDHFEATLAPHACRLVRLMAIP